MPDMTLAKPHTIPSSQLLECGFFMASLIDIMIVMRYHVSVAGRMIDFR